MCTAPRMPEIQPIAAPLIAANQSNTAGAEAALEARLRQARSSAAANVLTSQRGIQRRGTTPRLGMPA